MRARLVLLAMVSALAFAPAAQAADASSDISVRLDRPRITLGVGEKFAFRTTITNNGSTTASDLVAHLNVLDLRGGLVDGADEVPGPDPRRRFHDRHVGRTGRQLRADRALRRRARPGRRTAPAGNGLDDPDGRQSKDEPERGRRRAARSLWVLDPRLMLKPDRQMP